MTYKAFTSALKTMGFEIPSKRPQDHSLRNYIPEGPIQVIPDSNLDRWNWDDLADNEWVPALCLRWETGGTRGEGNWLEGDGRAVGFTSEMPMPMWDDLDNILEQFCPSISYLNYRKLERLVKLITRTDSGYYGDSTNYAIKILYLKDLWKFLQSHKLFEDA